MNTALRMTWRLLTSLLCVLTVAVLMPIAPASASEIVPAPPPGFGGNGSGGNQAGNPATVACATPPGGDPWSAPEGFLDRNGDNRITAADNPLELVFDVFPGCFGYQWTGDFYYCTTGFEVWRFYGTVNNPVQAQSASQAAVPSDRCGRDQVLIHENHPDDTGAYLPTGTYPYREASWVDQNTGGPLNMANTPSGWAYTTSAPFSRNGSCTALENKNPELARIFAGGDLYDSLSGQAVRQYFEDRRNETAALFGTGFGERWWDLSGTDANGQVNGPDNVPCGSGRDFAVEIPDGQDEDTYGERRLSGYCYIPVTRYMERFTLAGTDWYAPRYDYSFRGSRPEYYNYGLYGGQAQDANPVFASAIQEYRNQVANEVTNRVPFSVPSAASDGQPPSGGPLAAGLWSRCVANYGDIYRAPRATIVPDDSVDPGPGDPGDPTDPGNPGDPGDPGDPTDPTDPDAPTERVGGDPIPGDGVRMIVTVPEAGSTGGLLNDEPTEVATRTARILCGNVRCTVDSSLGPWISTVDVDLDIIAPPSVDADDWRTRPGSEYQPNRRGRGTWGLDFFESTTGDEEYLVEAEGTALIWGYEIQGSYIVICGPTALGGICENVSTETRVRSERTVPLVVRYRPDQSFPVGSGTATPIAGRGSNAAD